MKKIGISILMILVILSASACGKDEAATTEKAAVMYEISDKTVSLQADLDNAELIIHVPEGFDISAEKYWVYWEECFDDGKEGIFIRFSNPSRGRAKQARAAIESQWQSIYSNTDYYEILSLEDGKFTNSYGDTVYYSDFWYKESGGTLNHDLCFYTNLDNKQYYSVSVKDFYNSGWADDEEKHYFAVPDLYNLDDYKFLMDEEIIEVQFYE